MERRKFLKLGMTGLASTPLIAGASDRLYGIPKSSAAYAAYAAHPASDNLVRLSLASHDIPVDVWESVVSMRRLYENVASDSVLLHRFVNKDNSLLTEYGLSANDIDYQSLELRVLGAAFDSEIKDASSRGDINAVFNRLNQLGVIDSSYLNDAPIGNNVKQHVLDNIGVYSDLVAAVQQDTTTDLSATLADAEVNGLVVVAVAVAVVTAVAIAMVGVISAAFVWVDTGVRYVANSVDPGPGAQVQDAQVKNFLFMSPDEVECIRNASSVLKLMGETGTLSSVYAAAIDDEVNRLVTGIIDYIVVPKHLDASELRPKLASVIRQALCRTYGYSA